MIRVSHREFEVLADVIAKLQSALFLELHDGGCHKCLGDGSDVLERVRAHRNSAFNISPAIPLGPGYFTLFDDSCSEARNMAALHFFLNVGVEA